jgi:glucokinase
MYIAGDIGGTKTNLALFKDLNTPIELKRYPSSSYPNLRAILSEYQVEVGLNLGEIKGACFAVAGPVIDGVCRATNLPWVVEKAVLEKHLGIETVFLLNDLEANAHSIEILPEEAFLIVAKGKVGAKGNRAIVSPGTGLGEAGIFWDGEKYQPFASEGGHCDFGPRNEQEIRLCQFLIEQFGHASYERILSGPGIITLFQFLVTVEGRSVPVELDFENVSAREITQLALEKQEPLCVETLRLFVTLLGAECSNVALKYLSMGGLYLGGGIPPKILPMIQSPYFLEGFLEKGRFKDLMEQIPIYLINDEKASLKGAAHFCEKTLRRGEYVQ